MKLSLCILAVLISLLPIHFLMRRVKRAFVVDIKTTILTSACLVFTFIHIALLFLSISMLKAILIGEELYIVIGGLGSLLYLISITFLVLAIKLQKENYRKLSFSTFTLYAIAYVFVVVEIGVL